MHKRGKPENRRLSRGGVRDNRAARFAVSALNGSKG